jgi:hypothetical protein
MVEVLLHIATLLFMIALHHLHLALMALLHATYQCLVVLFKHREGRGISTAILQ